MFSRLVVEWAVPTEGAHTIQ